MRKGLLLFSLLVVLAVPAMGAPRDDDPRGSRDVVQRIVLLFKRLVGAFDDGIQVGPPRP
jgi:hypothetical protein